MSPRAHSVCTRSVRVVDVLGIMHELSTCGAQVVPSVTHRDIDPVWIISDG
ncbi:MAG: hypothetical protein ACI9MX_001974 [Candidatus Aldehydirespiratoraceae bacterium]|jgi:hypothetical protein